MKEVSDQTRVVIASALSLAVVVVWSLLYRPTPPASGAGNAPASSSATAATPAGAGVSQPAAVSVAAAASPNAVGDTAEKTIVVESGLYRIELSNRGAVVRSWQLKKYNDANKPPKQLNLVYAETSQEVGNWPFSLQLADAQIEQTVNRALYRASVGEGTSSETSLKAPAEIDFRWSDGQLAVTKHLKFSESYIVEVQSSVQKDGQPIPHRLAWRGGFGDLALAPAERFASAFTGVAGGISVTASGSLGVKGQTSIPADVAGSFDVVGLEDHYFAAAFMPPAPDAGQVLPAIMTLSGRQLARSTEIAGKAQQEILPEIAAGTTVVGPLDLRVFVGPKDLDILKTVRPPLDSLVQFGWFGFIAAPLFYVLRWMHTYVPNYGWAIVLLTAAINTVLYPLTLRSWRSMQRMQKVAPEIKSIQDRYKKYGMRDPRKQEMNKEVMAVYAREGINPMGSCLPMLAQMPIWFGINRMLTATIELRHAPWMGWIIDLSTRDPYYILPVLMAVMMYVQQKMTPMTATDPSQQRMMSLMPLMMGGMFIFLPLSSGLYLYILTSNVIGVAQRWHLNRTSPVKSPKKRAEK
jgi:YidC/Oxa1 family membrane protein insertase